MKKQSDHALQEMMEGPSESAFRCWSNRLWVLQSKVAVLSANGKGHRNGQVSAVKLNESEELKKRRKDE